MTPTILVAGATGNTGVVTVETLSAGLKNHPTLSGHRILATTRSAQSATAQRLAKLPGVEVVEQNWIEITPKWLREQGVTRAFVASHNMPRQFAEESTFLMSLLQAGVEYVVRISTTACNVRPDCPAYYPRAHWAIEAMLDTPQFSKLKWSSLQANIFQNMMLYAGAELIKRVRKGEDQGSLPIFMPKDVPVGLIHPDDVGGFAGTLLLEEDVSKHDKKRYVLNGPEDVTGAQIVDMVEGYIQEPVKDPIFEDMSLPKAFIESSDESSNVMSTILDGTLWVFAGEATAATTSKEVLELYPPKIKTAEVLKKMAEGQ